MSKPESYTSLASFKDEKVTTIFIGNPGVGKSTLLNGLVGEFKFPSGYSCVDGLTYELKEERDKEGNCYIDTPGLFDSTEDRREHAAKEIEKALKKGGIFRIFFVTKLYKGRMDPQDKTTMKVVLQAAEEIGNCYSIVVNGASERDLETYKLTTNRDKLLLSYNDKLSGTSRIHFNPFDPNLDEKDNQVPLLSDEFLRFIREAPVIVVSERKVQQIQWQELEKLQEAFSKIQREIESNKQLHEQKLKEQEAKLKAINEERALEKAEWKKKIKEQEARLKEEAERMIKEQEKKLSQKQEKLEEFKAEIRNKDLNHKEEILNLNARVTQAELTSQQREGAIRNEMEKEKKELGAQIQALKIQQKLANQRWKIILSKKTDKVIDLENGSSEAGTHISQYALHNRWNQQWFIESTGSDAKTYKITSRQSGLVLDIAGASTKGGAQLIQWPWHGGTNQQWVLEETVDGYFFIKSAGSNLVLDVVGASTADSAKIIQWEKHGGENQLWKIIDTE